MHPDVEHAILFDEVHDTADGTGVEVADKFASMIRGAPLHDVWRSISSGGLAETAAATTRSRTSKSIGFGK